MKLFSVTIKCTIILIVSINNIFAQHGVVSNDKMNVVYIGVPNPMNVVMENCPCKDLLVTTSNGVLEGKGCYYVLTPSQVGITRIIVSNKKSKTGSIVEYEFRTKMIPLPIFKIAQYGGYCSSSVKRIANQKNIAAQQYVRADYENLDFDARASIDSFQVTISGDSSVTKRILNVSNKISDELHNAFLELHVNDMIVFDKIFAKGPDEIERELDPLILYISE